MKKIILGILLTSFGFSLSLHAQASERAVDFAEFGDTNQNSKIYKRFTIRLEGDSGTLVPRWNMRIFEKNEGIFGLRYAQNFSKVSWLEVYLDLEFKTTMVWNYNGTTPNSVLRYAIANTVFETGLNLSEYLAFSMSSDGLMKITPAYAITIKDMHRIKIYTGVEFFFTGTRGLAITSGLGGTPVPASGSTLDLFRLGISYQVSVGKFSYLTDFSYRATGDNAEDFSRYSRFRWDNTFYFNLGQGTLLFGTIRYQPRMFAPPNTSGDVHHQLNLLAGIRHTFDFVKLEK